MFLDPSLLWVACLQSPLGFTQVVHPSKSLQQFMTEDKPFSNLGRQPSTL
jgi:hypothetical protein